MSFNSNVLPTRFGLGAKVYAPWECKKCSQDNAHYWSHCPSCRRARPK